MDPELKWKQIVISLSLSTIGGWADPMTVVEPVRPEGHRDFAK